MSWFRVHRGWMNSHDFAKEPFTEREAWLWIVENAAYEAHKRFVSGNGIDLARGQLIASQRNLSEIWKWGRQRVRGFIAKLEQVGSITQNSTHGLTMITVCNYERYQGEQPNAQPSSNPAATQQQPIKEEGKEGKERKEVLRGTRLTQDFEFPPEWQQWAMAEKRWGLREVREEWSVFVDYWISQPGQKGVKLDWFATWRNWVKRSNRQKRVLAP